MSKNCLHQSANTNIITTQNINGIQRLNDDKFSLTHENGEHYDIFENILTKPMNEIKKYTFDLRIYRENLIIKSFLDEGAFVTICGINIAKLMMKHLDNLVQSSMTAGGMMQLKLENLKSSTKFKFPQTKTFDKPT